jgi:hypothetical protein
MARCHRRHCVSHGRGLGPPRADGTTATGRCESRIEALADGRLRLHETWAWESQEGAGTSVVEEIL